MIHTCSIEFTSVHLWKVECHLCRFMHLTEHITMITFKDRTALSNFSLLICLNRGTDFLALIKYTTTVLSNDAINSQYINGKGRTIEISKLT